MHPLEDTIVAISSPPGGAARGIVRLSGPQTLCCAEAIFRPDGPAKPNRPGTVPIFAQRKWDCPPAMVAPKVLPGSIRLPQITSSLPCDLYLWPNRRSYTGQVVAEIHTLGSPPLLEAVLGALCAAGARLAEPGEFTLRAFLAGQIDLTQAEAVLGVIDAADGQQLQVALSQLAGGLAAPLQRLRDMLLELLAHLEAGFDFADEDLTFITPAQLREKLGGAEQAVARLAAQMASRQERPQQTRVVLVGRHNAGKSSLFNAMARSAGAIVSEHPGTTRDYLTAELDFGGVKCQLVDTAGMAPRFAEPPVAEDAGGGVEETARALSAEQDRRAGVRILCIDSTEPPDDVPEEGPPDDGAIRIVVLTKIDACGETGPARGRLPADTHGILRTSSVTGQGIDALREAIRSAVLDWQAGGATAVAATAVRCRESLRLADEGLRRARQLVEDGRGEELLAAEVRAALHELGKVAGAVYTEDLLDRIFSRFCIGK